MSLHTRNLRPDTSVDKEALSLNEGFIHFRAASQVLMSDEKRLTKYILENYERVGLNGRPTFNSSDAIDVAVTLSLVRINDVDTEHQVMDSLGWLAMVSTSCKHYSDVIMSAMASQIIIITTIYPTVYSRADQRKQQSSASQAFVREIHRWPVNSPHKGPLIPRIFPSDDVIMKNGGLLGTLSLTWFNLITSMDK